MSVIRATPGTPSVNAVKTVYIFTVADTTGAISAREITPASILTTETRIGFL
ncbi:MAG: hypothetical protein FWF94_02145 [Oscillospiraceae bacterium]|nr:hypothetical protein [Oscillospiraceae bacterium]